MAELIKPAGSALGILSLVVGTGYTIFYFSSNTNTTDPALQNQKSKPKTTPISTSKYPSGSKAFGSKYAQYFPSTDESNNAFWNSRLDNLLSEVTRFENNSFFKGEFQDAHGKANNDKSNQAKKTKALEELKKACETKYETEYSGVQNTDTNLWQEFWKFCSIEGEYQGDGVD